MAHAPVPVLVITMFCFSFQYIAVMVQAETCKSVESTSDKCRSADYITVEGQRVNKGDTKIIRTSGFQTEIQWFCGSSQERTAWSTPANQLQISYQSDGTIQWDIKKCAPTPACENVESTSDKCRSADHITVDGQRVNKGDVNKIIQLAGLQTEVEWFCGSSKERTAWSTPANQLKITYEDDGTIQWNIYKCVQSEGNFVHIGLADLIMICLIAIAANMRF